MEELLALRNWVNVELQSSASLFFQQLAAHYPTDWAHWQAQMQSLPVDHLRTNLHRGTQQGLYHAALDVEARVADWFAQFEAINPATLPGASVAELHSALFNAFLTTLVTPAGALVARRLQEAAPYY